MRAARFRATRCAYGSAKRRARDAQECNSIKLEWLKTAEVCADDPTELRLVQYVPRGAETARYAHTKAKVAEGALAELLDQNGNSPACLVVGVANEPAMTWHSLGGATTMFPIMLACNAQIWREWLLDERRRAAAAARGCWGGVARICVFNANSPSLELFGREGMC